MADQLNSFPLVISVKEDGGLDSTVRSIESFLSASATRAGSAFEAAGRRANHSFKLDGARREIDQTVQAALALFNQRSNSDPLGIRASLAALPNSPFQKLANERLASEGALGQQRARAAAENVAAVQRELDAALSAIGARRAAQTAAFQQAKSEGNRLIGLDRQRATELAALIAPPRTIAFSIDGAGAQAAATAARLQAEQFDATARAAERARDSVAKATLTDEAFAVAARTAADAARNEADRLTALATTQAAAARAYVAPRGVLAPLAVDTRSGSDRLVAGAASLDRAAVAGVTLDQILGRISDKSATVAANVARTRQELEDAALAAQREADAVTQALARQIEAAGRLVAAPSQQTTSLYFDPSGAQAAATAARLQASALAQVANAAELTASATNAATESDRAFALTAREAASAAGIEAGRLEALAATQGRVAAATIAAGGKISAAGNLVTSSVRGQRFATIQASQQFQDFFIQLQGGQNPLVAFSQQASQLAFVMANTGGEVGAFATFMGGPWGTLIFAGLSVLTLLTSGLFDNKKAAEDAKAGASGLAEAQSVLGGIFDLTSGKLKTQNELLLLNARLTAINLRSDAQKEAASSRQAFADVGRVSLGDRLKGALETPFAPILGLTTGTERGSQNAYNLTNVVKDLQAGRTTVEAVLRAFEKIDFTGLKVTREQAEQAIIDAAQSKLKRKTADLIDKSLDDKRLAPIFRTVRPVGGTSGRTPGPDPESAAKRDPAALAAELARVAGKYDAVKAAALEYAKALDEIATLEKAGSANGGVSTEEADRYRAAAAAARDKQIADAKAAAAERAITPLERATAEMGQQLALQTTLANGQERSADILRLQNQLQDRYKLSSAAALDLAIRQVDAEDALARKKERTYALIAVQVRAAQDLQSALTDALTEPFAKGSIQKLSDSFTQIRKRAIAEELSIKLFGDLGSKVHDALTRNNAPTVEAANDLKGSAKDLSAAAGEIAAAVAGRGPSLAQAATTPSAFGLKGASPDLLALLGKGNGVSGAGPFGNGQDQPDIIVTAPKLEKSAGLLAGATVRGTSINDKLNGFLGKNSVALQYAADAIGGKGGAAINGLLNVKNFRSAGDEIAKSIGGSVGKVAGNAFAGIGQGQAADGVVKLLGLKGSATGAAIGGAIGGAIAGPIGGYIGGFLGSITGGLLTKPKYGTASLTGTGNTTISGNSASVKSGAGTLAGSVQDGLKQIADQLNATLGNYAVSIGTFDGKYRVSTTGFTGSLDSKKAKGQGLVDFGTDGEAAAIAYAISDALHDGAITGIREGTKRLIGAAGDLNAQLQKALSFENVFTELKQYQDPVGAAIDALDKQFGTLRKTFAEAGASTQEYSDLEALYAYKRADAVKAATKDLSSSLQNLLDDLKFKGDTGLSLRTREANAATAFAPLAGAVRAGQVVDQDKFAEAAQAYLGIERELFGSTAAYFTRLTDITGLTEKAIANAGGTAAAAAVEAAKASSPPASAATPGVVPTNTDVVTAINQQTTQINKGFDLLISTTGKITIPSAANTVSPFPYYGNYDTLRNA